MVVWFAVPEETRATVRYIVFTRATVLTPAGEGHLPCVAGAASCRGGRGDRLHNQTAAELGCCCIFRVGFNCKLRHWINSGLIERRNFLHAETCSPDLALTREQRYTRSVPLSSWASLVSAGHREGHRGEYSTPGWRKAVPRDTQSILHSIILCAPEAPISPKVVTSSTTRDISHPGPGYNMQVC